VTTPSATLVVLASVCACDVILMFVVESITPVLTPSARPTAPPSECDTSNLPETPIQRDALKPPR
jgi:hypothetical protein